MDCLSILVFHDFFDDFVGAIIHFKDVVSFRQCTEIFQYDYVVAFLYSDNSANQFSAVKRDDSECSIRFCLAVEWNFNIGNKRIRIHVEFVETDTAFDFNGYDFWESVFTVSVEYSKAIVNYLCIGIECIYIAVLMFFSRSAITI